MSAAFPSAELTAARVPAVGLQPAMSLIQAKGVTARNKLIVSGCDTDTLIIGFDAEWVTPKTVDIGEDAPLPLPTELEHFRDDPLLQLTGRNVILSYQVACRAPNGQEWKGIAYTTAGADLHPNIGYPDPRLYPERWELGVLLARIIRAGLRCGYLTRWPKRVIAAAHWTRADLSAFADFPEIKSEFDTVNKTFVTLLEPYRARVNIGKNHREFDVELVDTQNLVPASSKGLNQLGKLHGFDKLDPGKMADDTPYIVRMDLLLQNDWRHYEAYAVKDAQICAKHTDWIVSFARNDLGLELKRPPATLGGLAVKYLEHLWKRDGIHPEDVNGFVKVTEKQYNQVKRKWVTSKVKHIKAGYALNEQLARDCFHGGRNECFYYGPTEAGHDRWREFDLASAYATALATLRVPDYDRARPTTDPSDFRVDQIGCALVTFRFPDGTRFPCFPVKAPHGRGLIFPLVGDAYATGPEIVLARRLGAQIRIKQGVVIPWKPDSPHPFKIVIADLLGRRKAAKGTLQDPMFKQMANSLYGKLAQGLSGRKVFNTRSEDHNEIGPCLITNPFLAAHVTGLVRACIGEMIASLPTNRTVVSVTTDSLITDASEAEIDTTSPVCRLLAAMRKDLTGDGTILEVKYTADQLIAWATRGVATLEPGQDEDGRVRKSKVAKRGMHEPRGEDGNEWIVRTLLTRTPDTTWTDNGPVPFPKAYSENTDHVFMDTEKRVTFEYDMKRRLVDPVTIVVPVEDGASTPSTEHLAANTAPWGSIDDFNTERDQFEQWRFKQGGQLRTMRDWTSWRAFRAGMTASKAGVRRGSHGPVDQVKRLFIRAYVRGEWGLPRRGYKVAAEALTAAGYPTSQDDFKNAARRYGHEPTPEHTIPAGADGIADFIVALKRCWPSFDTARLLEAVQEDRT